MALTETFKLLLGGIAGAGLGAIFFGGLSWTIHKGVLSPRPALWFSVSLLLRMSIAVAGFYFVSGGDWKRLLACLIGFTLARLAITWSTGLMERGQTRPNQEAIDAP